MPPLPALQPDYRDKLVKLLGMLGSDHDGERAAAARLADEHRRKCGLQWGDLILPAGKLEPASVTGSSPPRHADGAEKARKPKKTSWRTKAEAVAESLLATDWERQFADNLLARWHGPLTEKQRLTLNRVWKKCTAEAEAA